MCGSGTNATMRLRAQPALHCVRRAAGRRPAAAGGEQQADGGGAASDGRGGERCCPRPRRSRGAKKKGGVLVVGGAVVVAVVVVAAREPAGRALCVQIYWMLQRRWAPCALRGSHAAALSSWSGPLPPSSGGALNQTPLAAAAGALDLRSEPYLHDHDDVPADLGEAHRPPPLPCRPSAPILLLLLLTLQPPPPPPGSSCAPAPPLSGPQTKPAG